MDKNQNRGGVIVVNPYAKKKRKRPEGSQHESPSVLDQTTSHQIVTPISTAHNNSSNKNVSAQASALIISASDKAGMEGIDRSKIDAIILRESGNSLYMQQQRRRDEKVNERVRQLQQKLKQASPSEWKPTLELDERLWNYQRSQATRATCVVVDMDMFYMACELLTRPDLHERPACVGRGMILTSNYVARKYGVRSAMAGFIGDKLVQELSGGTERLIHVRSNFDLYKEKSRIVTQVIREYDPFTMKSYSLDEVYLDIGPYLAVFLQHRDYTHEQIKDALLSTKTTGSDKHRGRAAAEFLQSVSSGMCLEAVETVVARLRNHVKAATGGLTCSAGVARTHTIAKIASDKNKPNGQLVVDPTTTLDFVWKLPVRKIPGVGRVTEKLLQSVCEVHTGKELYEKRGLVKFLFQPATAKFLLRASVGCSGSGDGTATFGMTDSNNTSSEEATDHHQKGISRERSFSPESDWGSLNSRLEDIARMLASDMLRKSVVGHTITVKVKLETFDVLSRSQSMKRGVYLQDPAELAAIASGLFGSIRETHLQKENHKFSVRLLGIRCSNLLEESSFRARKEGCTIHKFLSSSESLTPPSDGFVGGSHSGSTDLNTTLDTIQEERKTTHNAGSFNKELFIQRYASDEKSIDASAKRDETTDVGKAAENSDPEEDSSAVVRCPLCSRAFPATDNDGLNAHIDTCLNGVHGTSTLRRAIQEEESLLAESCETVSGAAQKRQRLTDFWN